MTANDNVYLINLMSFWDKLPNYQHFHPFRLVIIVFFVYIHEKRSKLYNSFGKHKNLFKTKWKVKSSFLKRLFHNNQQ